MPALGDGIAEVAGPDSRSRLLGEIVLLAAIVSLYSLVILPLLGRPFSVGHDGFNGAVFSMSAVNTLRFGLRATRGGPTLRYWDEKPPATKEFYTSKPYGHPLLVAAAYALFGVSERVGRSLSFVFCLALFLLFYGVGRAVGASLGGLVMAGAAASLPMMHDFGPLMTGQIPSLVFVLALYFFYWRCLDLGQAPGHLRAGIFLAFFAAGVLDWHVFSHLPVLMLHFAWNWRRRPQLVLRFWLVVVLAAALPLVLFLAQTYWLEGFPYLLGKLKQRTGFAPAVDFTWPQFFARQWTYLRSMYRTPTVLVAVVAFLLPAVGSAREIQRLARLSAAAALAETLFLNEAIYIHIYYTFVWVIPICLALGSLAELAASGLGEPMTGTVAAVLLSLLFASAFAQAKSEAEDSWRRSGELVRLAQSLSPRLEPGQKVIFYMGKTQVGPQIRYYLKGVPLYPRSLSEVEVEARRCRECRFVVVRAQDPKTPDTKLLRQALMRRYPHDLAYGFYVFTLPRD